MVKNNFLQVNESLERQIAERTQELQESERYLLATIT